MSAGREDQRRRWRRGVRAAWAARAEDPRLRRLVRDELDVIADRIEWHAARSETGG